MQSVTRLEIVISSVELENVLGKIEACGASGYTVIREITGKGHRGIRDGADLSDAFRNTMIVTACTAEQATELIEVIRPILKRRGGICLISDSQWIVH